MNNIPAPTHIIHPDDWPAPPRDEVHHGVVGQVVKIIDPHSEADPIAIGLQLLAATGNAVGRNPHFMVEQTKHHLNLYTVIVGNTAKARKGSSWSHVDNLLADADNNWQSNCVKYDISTGEGLVFMLRDPVIQFVSGEQQIKDPGISDKRLLVMATEFAGILQKMKGGRSTLSPKLRDAWDRGRLENITKQSSLTATGAHVSMIGHITLDEIHRRLPAGEISNGFVNRCLFACVKRSKQLPRGGTLSPDELKPIIDKLSAAIKFGQAAGRIDFDEAAGRLWDESYPYLTRNRPGIIDTICARAEAQTIRLACIYAVLDQSRVVRIEHLQAALAWIDYAERCAQFVFGRTTTDPLAAKLLAELSTHPDGLTKSAIFDLTHRNYSADDISWALHQLKDGGHIQGKTVRTPGRPAEVWMLREHAGKAPETAIRSGTRKRKKRGKPHRRSRVS